METERNIFDAKWGDVFYCTHSRNKDRDGEIFIIGSRKKCKHPNKEKMEVYAKDFIQMCWSLGDTFKFVKS